MFSENSDVRRIQKAELESLKMLDDICQRNKLTYYVCGGTLIGTIREKGFIPWDDDVDVMMPRKDYEWLLCHKDELFQDPFFVCGYSGADKEHVRLNATIYNTSVCIIIKDRNKEKEQYSNIDVFPLDGMPKGKIRRYVHYYHVFFWRVVVQLSRYDVGVNQYRKNRNGLERLFIYVMNHVKYRPKWDSVKAFEKWNKVMAKYDINTSDMVCSLTGPQRRNEILSANFFNEILRMPFENIEVNVPSGYDAELRHYYGDYMTPPETAEEKELHHRIEIIGEK